MMTSNYIHLNSETRQLFDNEVKQSYKCLCVICTRCQIYGDLMMINIQLVPVVTSYQRDYDYICKRIGKNQV